MDKKNASNMEKYLEEIYALDFLQTEEEAFTGIGEIKFIQTASKDNSKLEIIADEPVDKDIYIKQEASIVAKKLAETYGISIRSRYYKLKRNKQVSEDWPIYKFILDFNKALQESGWENGYVHKINQNELLSGDNFYLSLKLNSNSLQTHGMCYTSLYSKYNSLKSYYKENTNLQKITFEQFMEYALTDVNNPDL